MTMPNKKSPTIIGDFLFSPIHVSFLQWQYSPSQSYSQRPLSGMAKQASRSRRRSHIHPRKLLIITFTMRFKSSLWILLIALLLQSCGTLNPVVTPQAQPNASPPDPLPDTASNGVSIPYGKNIRFEHISLEDGLSQSVVNAILQDSKGFLWVGTDDGLNRYDGYSFSIFKPDTNNPASLSDRSITTLTQDAQGFIWIGTRQGGLNRYDPVSGTFTHYMHNEVDDQSVASNLILSLLADETGIWIGTDNGLDFLDFSSGRFTHYYSPEEDPADGRSLSSNTIRALYKDSQNLLWIGTTNGGLNMYDPRTGIIEIFKHDKLNRKTISSNRVLSITEAPDGSIWIGTANGLNQLNVASGEFKRFENSRYLENSLAGTTVNAILIDQWGSLWVGTNRGLDRFDAREGNFIHHQSQPGIPNSLSNNQVISIYEDDSGVIWVGTFGGGLNKYNRQQDRFAYYRHEPNDVNSLSSNFIMSLFADRADNLWIGTLDNGLSRLDLETETFAHFKNNPNIRSSLSSNFVHSLYVDSTGTLWVGTGKALDRFNPLGERFTNYAPPVTGDNENIAFSVAAMYEDSQSNFWVGSTQGLFLFDRNTKIFSGFNLNETERGALDGYSITAIAEGRSGYLWVGTFNGGLKRIHLDTGFISHYENDPGNGSSIGNNSILCLFRDSRGLLWVGTNGGGLSRYNPATDSFTNYTETSGLPNNVIYGILEDDKGNLWLSTNFGLSRFNPQDESFRNFTASDGLQSNEFNQNAYAIDGNGTMYFGGINGLNVFQPREIVDNPYPPRIALTSVTFDGIQLTDGQTPEYRREITLQWPNESFEFEFTAFAFEQTSKNRYAYMLEGFDPDWIEIEGRRNGRYTNLPGGTYTLRLRGSNSDGIWNETNETIQIVVVPPFWETWWFTGLLVLTMVTMVVGGMRWRVKNIENRNQELERLVRIRTADLEKRTGEIEALYLADEKLLRSVTLNQIFQALVDVSITILKADRSLVLAWNEEKQRVMPRISRGFKPESLNVMRYERDEGMIGVAMSTGNNVIISDIDPSILREDIRHMVETEGIESFAHFPIVVDERVVALFTVAYTRSNALTKDSIRLFTAIVNRASMSIANMELFDQTRDLAVMEERNRLARDLHDSAKQKAFAALAQLGTVNGMTKVAPQGYLPDIASPHLNEAETLVYEVIQELNFLIQEIYPIALQEKGLPTVLREYTFEWENRNDAMIHLNIQNERALPLETEQAVYRVIQEALANVSRHSRAQRVDISLMYSNDQLQVTVSDDGVGFDVNQKAKGLGFRSMRERIISAKGTFQVQSSLGTGTRIMIHIPLRGFAGETL